MLTIILIILFFVVLALKPAYIIVGCTDDDGTQGTIISCTPLIVALYTRLRFEDTYLINARMYDKICEKYCEEEEEES